MYGLTLEGACRAVLLARDEDDWGNPVDLYLAYAENGQWRLSRTQLILTMIMRDLADGGRRRTPGELLHAVAATCEEWGVREAAPHTLRGVALYSEGVVVIHDHDDVGDSDQIHAHQRDRTLHTHPRAEDRRHCYGLEAGQPPFVLDLPRHGGREIERLPNMTGQVIDGLRAIANALVPHYQERNH